MKSIWKILSNSGILDSLEQELKPLGFRKGEAKDEFLQLEKPTFEHYSVLLRFSPVSGNNKIPDFTAQIALASKDLADSMREMKLWECDDIAGRSKLSKQYYEMPYFDLVVVPLHWLILNSDDERVVTEWEVEASDLGSSAKQFVEDFIEYGLPFLRNFNRTDDVIRFIQNISDFPRRLPTQGVMAPGGRFVTTLLYSKEGNQKEAKEELQAAIQEETEQIQKLFGGDKESSGSASVQLRCKAKKYEAYIDI